MPDQRKVFAFARFCTGCRSCEIACAIEHSESKTLLSALFESPPPRYRIDVQSNPPAGELKLPLMCRHCREPDCLFACKAGAISKDPVSGEVRINLQKCVGCWMCVMVCPFGVVISDAERAKAVKCDLCQGRIEGPACVQSCPTKALIYSTISDVESK